MISIDNLTEAGRKIFVLQFQRGKEMTEYEKLCELSQFVQEEMEEAGYRSAECKVCLNCGRSFQLTNNKLLECELFPGPFVYVDDLFTCNRWTER